jgi:MFS family permease
MGRSGLAGERSFDEEVDVSTTSIEPVPAGLPEPETVEDRVGLPRIVAALSLVNAATRVAWVATSTVLLPAQIIAAVGEGQKETWLGIILTVGSVAGIIASPFLGRWSDRTRSRLGRRAPWLLAGVGLAAVAYVLIGLITQSIVLVVAWSMQQVAYMAISIATSTVLPERVPLKKRGMVTGVTALVAVGAALTASFIGVAFIARPLVGMLVMAGLCLVGGIVFVVLAPMHPSTEPGTAAKAPEKFHLGEFVAAFRDGNYRWTWISTALLTLAVQFMLSRIVFFSQAWFDQDVSTAAKTAAAAVATGGIAQMLAMVATGPLSDRLGRRPFIYAGGVLLAGGLLLILSTHDTGTFMIAYSIVCLGSGLFMGVQAPLASDVLPNAEDFGKDMGFFQLSNQVPQMLAPAIGSVIVVVSGSYGPMLAIGAASAVLGALAATRIKGVR